MKVTMIAREYPPYVYGGAGVHLRYLSQELSKIMEVEVRCFGDQNIPGQALSARGYRMPPEFEAKTHKFNPAIGTFATNLHMMLDPFDSDIVHTHTWYASFGGFLAKTLYQVPLVATCHSLEPLRPWKVDQLGNGYHLSTWIEDLVIRNADRVVGVSRLMKQDVLEHFPIRPERVAVIHNGIDPDKWKHTPISDELKKTWGIQDDYILFVGRPTKQKGMEYLIEARERIDPGVQIVMGAVGADTREYEEMLEKRIAGRKGFLWIHKLLKEEEYIQLYSSAKVFVCPSIYEPFGIINLEAMACRTPVVATAVGGIKEVVVPEKTGLLIPPADPQAIADAVNRLLKDRKTAERFGEAGRQRVEERFSWAYIARQTKKMYQELLAGRRKAIAVPDLPADATLNRYGFDSGTFQALREDLIAGRRGEGKNVVTGAFAQPDAGDFRDVAALAQKERTRLAKVGREAMAAGKLGVAIVNGGMATRFGGKVKGIVEVFDGKSFLELKLEQVARAAKRAKARVPVFIMNSFATEAETVRYLERNDFFGIPRQDVFLFSQFIFPRLNPDGSIFSPHPERPHERYYGPGHGDFVFALRQSGALREFLEQGGEHLWYSNVDNLGATPDEILLGLHLESGAEMTVELAKKLPGDKGGAPARVDGRLQLVEGFGFPKDFDADRIPVFNTATYLFRAAALDREFELPWYATEKQVGDGKAVQFERLTGDLSRFLSTHWIVVEREERFFPVKTPQDLEAQRAALKKRLSK